MEQEPKNEDREVFIRRSVQASVYEKTDIEKLKKLMTLKDYKHFSTIYNDAARIGISVLYNRIFGENEVEKDINKVTNLYDSFVTDKELMARLIQLLQEINLNATLSKNILCAIFGYLSSKANEEDALKLQNGQYIETPEFLKDFELYAIKQMES